jgi:hypothetical protein
LLDELSAQLRERLGVFGGKLEPLDARGAHQEVTLAYRALLSGAERFLRERGAGQGDEVRAARDLIKDLRRVLRLRPEMYPSAALTQEQIAEHIKRLRNDYCFGSVRDNINRFMPRPAGARVAHMRVAQPLNITQALAAGTESRPTTQAMLATLRARMQQALNEINAELQMRGAFIEYPNPFALPA